MMHRPQINEIVIVTDQLGRKRRAVFTEMFNGTAFGFICQDDQSFVPDDAEWEKAND